MQFWGCTHLWIFLQARPGLFNVFMHQYIWQGMDDKCINRQKDLHDCSKVIDKINSSTPEEVVNFTDFSKQHWTPCISIINGQRHIQQKWFRITYCYRRKCIKIICIWSFKLDSFSDWHFLIIEVTHLLPRHIKSFLLSRHLKLFFLPRH